jgi:hypothetical protein
VNNKKKNEDFVEISKGEKLRCWSYLFSNREFGGFRKQQTSDKVYSVFTVWLAPRWVEPCFL